MDSCSNAYKPYRYSLKGFKYQNNSFEVILVFKSLHAGKFGLLFCCLLIFFEIKFFKKFFQQYHQGVKQFDADQGQCFVEPNLG